MPEHQLVPDWLSNPDVVLLRDIATAVVHLAGVDQLDSFTLPYPASAQRALDALVLQCLRNGSRPPAGVPEMIRWARARPLGSWPLDRLPTDLFGAGDRLIDEESGEPAQLCHELAVDGYGSSTGRQYDRLVIQEALRACRAMSSPESYTAFRRLLVTQPVLTTDDWMEVSTDLHLDPVRFLIEEIYAPVPLGYRRDGSYLCCHRCLTLLTPLSGKEWWCERDQCRHRGTPPPGRRLVASEVGELRQLRKPLRQFVTGPGQAESSLEGSCAAWGSRSRCGPASTRTTCASRSRTGTSGPSTSRTGPTPVCSDGLPPPYEVNRRTTRPAGWCRASEPGCVATTSTSSPANGTTVPACGC